MPQLTREQFESFRTQAEETIRSFEKKDALLLSQQLEKQLAGLEIQDPALFSQARKILVQLRWMACQFLRDEREFLKLVRENFLEGLELDQEEKAGPKALLNLLEGRFALQFGAGLEESLQRFLQALQENNQVLGSQTITLKGEIASNRATVGRWIVDFLRSSPENPSEIDETNYLFSNPNAQTLSAEEKKTLSKILNFYGIFRYVLQQLTPRRTQGEIDFESLPPEKKISLVPPQTFQKPPQSPQSALIQKPLRQAVQDNKEILDQLITIDPIKIGETAELNRPTIRHWLSDYLKQKGNERHQPIQRNDYLFNNLNAKKLSANERTLLGKILQAYDETEFNLPFSPQTNLISIDELLRQIIGETQLSPREVQKPFVETAAPAPIIPAPTTQKPTSFTPAGTDRYREPVSLQDFKNPQKLAPRPAPKISGNVIDLKEFRE